MALRCKRCQKARRKSFAVERVNSLGVLEVVCEPCVRMDERLTGKSRTILYPGWTGVVA